MISIWVELRAAVVTMVAVLASYGAALYLEDVADLHVDVVIQAVVLSWTAAWIQRGADLRNLLLTCAVLPPLAVAAAGLAELMSEHTTVGDAVFVACFGLSIWVRRFGPRATRAGTLAVLPLIASLVLQGPVVAPFDDDHTAWLAVIALVAAACVVVAQLGARRLGLVPPAEPALDSAPRKAPAGRRVSASTRLALQMAAALAAAFVVGRNAYPDHFAWVVLTAFIVGSGARARTDVVQRGALRAVGAAIGTAVATWIAGGLGAHDDRSVVLIFVVLAFATWLRSVNYAFWAACVTALLSLLFGYFGESAPDLLRTRLEAILVGAVLGIAASWLILPIRTGAVVRRRAADALGTLAGLLATDPWAAPVLDAKRASFEEGVRQLGQAARPLRWFRWLRRAGPVPPGIVPVRHRRAAPWHRPADADYAAAVDAVRSCVPPARAIARCAAAHPGLRADPRVATLAAATVANITAARLAIGKRPGGGYRPPPQQRAGRPGGRYRPAPQQRADRPGAPAGTAVAAIADIDRALATLTRIFPPVPAPAPPPPVPTAS